MVGKLRSKTKCPNHMMAYDVTKSSRDQSGRKGTNSTAVAMIGQPTPRCKKWLTGWLWSALYLAARYWRVCRRRGPTRALLAVGHTLLVLVYQVLKRRAP